MRAQTGAHVLERSGKTGSNELGKVLVLVLLNLLKDVVSNRILVHLQSVVKHNMLDGEVNWVDTVVDSQGNNCSLIIREDSGYAEIKCLVRGIRLALARGRGLSWQCRNPYPERWTKMIFFLYNCPQLLLAVQRSGRRELAALLESHDGDDEGTKALRPAWFGQRCGVPAARSQRVWGTARVADRIGLRVRVGDGMGVSRGRRGIGGICLGSRLR